MSWISRVWMADTMQISPKFRRYTRGLVHWCPGCEELHMLPDTWTFNGDLSAPSFSPSFKHTVSGEKICHYVLTNGILAYCADCTHQLVGKSIPLPDLPAEFCDPPG